MISKQYLFDLCIDYCMKCKKKLVEWRTRDTCYLQYNNKLTNQNLLIFGPKAITNNPSTKFPVGVVAVASAHKTVV